MGTHFFSPANIMRLLEVVRGEVTSDETLATVMAVGKKLKKAAVVSLNAPWVYWQQNVIWIYSSS